MKSLIVFGCLIISAAQLSAQQKDPKEAACVIFSVDADTPVYDILLQPELILKALETTSRPADVRDWMNKFFEQHALPYFKLNPLAFDDLLARYSSWRSEKLTQLFAYKTDELRAKVENLDHFTNQEKALLIHATAMAYLSALRETQDPQQKVCLRALETQLESSLSLNEAVLTIDPEYRNQMIGLALALVDGISERSSEMFDQLKSRIIDPLKTSTFKGADAEIDWLQRLAGRRDYLREENLTLKQFAFLNVFNRAILLTPPPNAYQWNAADLKEIGDLVTKVNAEISPEVKESIVRHSRQYAMVIFSKQQRELQADRVWKALRDDRMILGLGGASLAAFVMSRDYVQINRGFWRLQSDFVDQAKLNIPKELVDSKNFDDEIRSLIQDPKKALPKSANAAFADSIRMGRLQYVAVERFKARFISVFGEKAWSKFIPEGGAPVGAAPTIREQVFKAGSDVLDETSMRRLSGALKTLETEGSSSIRQAALNVRKAMDANPGGSLVNIKGWRVEMRAAYRDIRSIGKAALAEDFVQAKVGASPLGKSLAWLRYQGRSARANFWSFPGYKGWKLWDYVDKVPYADRMPFLKKILDFNEFKVSPSGLRQGFGGVSAAGQEVAVASKYSKVLPGEGLAASSTTWRSLGRGMLHTASWILLLYSIGQVTYDGVQAYRIRSPQAGFEDLKSKEVQKPEDSQIESSFIEAQLSALRASPELNVDTPIKAGDQTVNERRLMNGEPEIEVVMNAESTGAIDPMTGFLSAAYVLFKVREPARDSTLEIRRQNALTGILVRFRLEKEGTDEAMVKATGVPRIPAKLRWVYDHAVLLKGLDPSTGGRVQEALKFVGFSMDTSAPKIVIDPQAAKGLFNRDPLWSSANSNR